MFYPTLVTSLILSSLALSQSLRLAITYVELYGPEHIGDTFVSLYILSMTLVVSMFIFPWAAVYKKWPLAAVCLVAGVVARIIAQRIQYGALDYDAHPCDVAIEAFVNGTARSGRLEGLAVAWHMESWQQLYDNSTEGWLLVLEEDVWPLSGFADNVRRAACQTPWADVVWLDARAAAEFTFRGAVGVGSAAMLYKREALPRIMASMMRFPPDDIDMVLYEACNQKMLQCAAYPLATRRP